MKFFVILPLALIFSGPLTCAQEETPAPAAEMAEWQQEFLNLPEATRQEFLGHLGKANELFQQKRVFECLDELHEAEKVFSGSPELYNLYGACQVEFRAFDKALSHFREAQKIAPDNPSVLFNIAEVQFVTKEWADAEASFEKIIEMTSGGQDQLQMARLVEFKLMLTKIKLDKLNEAREMAVKYDYFDDSPFPYYADAALAYHEGDEIKAETEIARASRIFRNPAIISPWQDTLMEFGYIKSFFGGELGEDSGAEESVIPVIPSTGSQ